ncbi:hypothetical protein BCV70DRAFT_202701 [Testicularia cyperi]|uniref:Enterotoxin n=1 Tax=Testicularia cyperi TaxID=1882483 RepID=A0A317XJE7_9BASI|nr:hypothetical protein BCV70DRAFT_202701 [Testicularia cyperi]
MIARAFLVGSVLLHLVTNGYAAIPGESAIDSVTGGIERVASGGGSAVDRFLDKPLGGLWDLKQEPPAPPVDLGKLYPAKKNPWLKDDPRRFYIGNFFPPTSFAKLRKAFNKGSVRPADVETGTPGFSVPFRYNEADRGTPEYLRAYTQSTPDISPNRDRVFTPSSYFVHPDGSYSVTRYVFWDKARKDAANQDYWEQMAFEREQRLDHPTSPPASFDRNRYSIEDMRGSPHSSPPGHTETFVRDPPDPSIVFGGQRLAGIAQSLPRLKVARPLYSEGAGGIPAGFDDLSHSESLRDTGSRAGSGAGTSRHSEDSPTSFSVAPVNQSKTWKDWIRDKMSFLSRMRPTSTANGATSAAAQSAPRLTPLARLRAWWAQKRLAWFSRKVGPAGAPTISDTATSPSLVGHSA